MKVLAPLFIFVLLSGCQKPINYDDLPETKYPDTPVMGAWELIDNG